MNSFEEEMCKRYGCRKPEVTRLWHRTSAEKDAAIHPKKGQAGPNDVVGGVLKTLKNDFKRQ